MFSDDTAKRVIAESSSFRQASKKLGQPNSHQKLKQLALQKEWNFEHFLHGKKSDRMVGETFGQLTVKSVERMNDSHRRVIAHCECTCGKTKDTRTDNLTSGKVISCGCHSKDRWNMVCGLNPAFKGTGEMRAGHLTAIKSCAKKRGIPFSDEFTTNSLWSLFQKQESKCALTGLEICFGRLHRPSETTASLDRIDSDRGYENGNVRWVLKDINMMRSCLGDEYFIRLCNMVARCHPRDCEIGVNEGRNRCEASPFVKERRWSREGE